MKPLFLSCLTIVLPALRLALADEVVLPTTSFDSYTDLETYWDYLYPWGSDHNGSMYLLCVIRSQRKS